MEPHHILQKAQPESEISKILVAEEPKGKPNLDKPYSLGPKISNWDK